VADDPDNTPDPDKGERSFTQADVDRIVQSRLAEEKKRHADYDELKAKAQKLDEQEAANQSELEKANAKLAEAEKRANEAQARADRLEVVVSKALDEEQAKRVTTAAKRLVGSSREELEADADDLLSSFAKPGDGEPPKPTPPGKPSEDLKGGGDPSAAPSPDIRKIVEDIPRGL